MIDTLLLPASNPDAISTSLSILEKGGAVAFPTDTVYGLAADLHNETAIRHLFEIKQRPPDKAIPVLLGSPDDLEIVADDPGQLAVRLAEKHWPGALTMVLPRKPGLPEILSPLPTIGVRIPDHPDAIALLQAAGPLAVTSANRSGHENAVTAEEVLAQLGGRVDLVLDGGQTPGGTPSTVIDLTTDTPRILRQGPVEIDLTDL